MAATFLEMSKSGSKIYKH